MAPPLPSPTAACARFAMLRARDPASRRAYVALVEDTRGAGEAAVCDGRGGQYVALVEDTRGAGEAAVCDGMGDQ